ncbi:MAG: hypothetical protein PHH21_00885 [Candidatus Pacebacteria bacterium]|nr:hypothetical protein [Candidatus Paceibacterota bacterium]
MYRELFDENHSLVSFKTLTPKSEQFVFSGEFEGNILCEKCDNELIAGLENYASKVLYGGNIPAKVQNFIKPDGLEFSQVEGIDYSKFKLFLLSILWRASISSRPFFSNVSLGPYEEKIRQMILNNNPRLPGDFPCVMISYRKRNFPNKLIMEPKRTRINEKNGYHFLIGGISYIFKIIEDDKTDWLLESVINEKGEFKVLHATEDQAKKSINKILGVEVPENAKFD